MIDLLSWVNTALRLLVASAFAIVCLARMRRIGVAAAWSLASIGILEVVLVLFWRLATFGLRAMPYRAADLLMNTLGVINVLTNLIAAGLVGAGLFLARNPPRGAQ